MVEPRWSENAKAAKLDVEALKKGRGAMEMGENHHSPREHLEIEGLATCRAMRTRGLTSSWLVI